MFLEIFSNAQGASKNSTLFKSGHKWLKNNHLLLLDSHFKIYISIFLTLTMYI